MGEDAKEEATLEALATVAEKEVSPPESEVKTEDKARKDLRRERNREHARISRERKRRKVEHLSEENEVLQRERLAALDECCRLRDLLSRSEHENARLRQWIDTVRYNNGQQQQQQRPQQQQQPHSTGEDQQQRAPAPSPSPLIQQPPPQAMPPPIPSPPQATA